DTFRDAAQRVGVDVDLAIARSVLLRGDLEYAGSLLPLGNTNGVVTEHEADAGLPLWDRLGLAALTGAQLQALFEHQFGPAAPSRPRHLSVSDNVTVTIDPTAPAGSKVRQVRLNGEPVDPTRTYRVLSTVGALNAQ